jgi:hypothetical protein
MSYNHQELLVRENMKAIGVRIANKLKGTNVLGISSYRRYNNDKFNVIDVESILGPIRVYPSNGRPVRVLAKDLEGKVLADSPEALTTIFQLSPSGIRGFHWFTNHHPNHPLPVPKIKVIECKFQAESVTGSKSEPHLNGILTIQLCWKWERFPFASIVEIEAEFGKMMFDILEFNDCAEYNHQSQAIRFCLDSTKS